MTGTDGDNNSRLSDRRITAWTDGSRGTAKQKAAGLRPKLGSTAGEQSNMVEKMT